MSQSPPTTGARYVYGIVAAREADDLDVRGVGDPPEPIEAVRHGDLAALVSAVPPDVAEASREDLRAHARALETIAEKATVLPMRFGMTLPGEAAVVEELLEAGRERWTALLEELDGTVELRLKGFHDQDRLLQRVAEDEPEVHRLQGSAALADRIRLGEVVVGALERHRQADAEWLLERLRPLARAVQEDTPALDGMVIDAAFLVQRGDVDAFDREVAAMADETEDRMRLRCLGPQPPYTFVTSAGEG